MRYRLLDAYKGILIILVILGHIMPYNLSENLPRNLIYAYHMGLFIGISGFLVDITGGGGNLGLHCSASIGNGR